MKLLRILLGAAAVATAGAAVSASVIKDRKRKEEIDAFLSPSPSGKYEVETSKDLSKVIDSLTDVDVSSVVFTFKVKDADMAHLLQEIAAQYHLTSSYYQDAQSVDLIYQGEFDQAGLDELREALQYCLKGSKATFESHYFE